MKSGLVGELGLSIIPSKYVSGRRRRTYTKCTLTDVEDGSMITQMCNKEIAQLVPILVGSRTYTNKAYSGARLGWWHIIDAIVSETQ